MLLRKEPNFSYLLAGILSLLVLGPLATSVFGTADGAVLLLGYNTLLIIGIWSLHDRKILFYVGLMLAAVNVVLSCISAFMDIVILDIFNLFILLTFQLLSMFIAAESVFSADTVTVNRLIGATCVYLLLGMCWGILFIFLAWLDPTAFVELNIESGVVFWDAMYLSFVTITTLGYGDMLPVTPFARALAYMEAVVGQIYIAVLIGALVGTYISERRDRKKQQTG